MPNQFFKWLFRSSTSSPLNPSSNTRNGNTAGAKAQSMTEPEDMEEDPVKLKAAKADIPSPPPYSAYPLPSTLRQGDSRYRRHGGYSCSQESHTHGPHQLHGHQTRFYYGVQEPFQPAPMYPSFESSVFGFPFEFEQYGPCSWTSIRQRYSGVNFGEAADGNFNATSPPEPKKRPGRSHRSKRMNQKENSFAGTGFFPHQAGGSIVHSVNNSINITGSNSCVTFY